MTETPLRVLVADDSRAVSRALERVLGRAGCDVLTVASGEAACTLLAAAEVDVVLLDLHMPGMSGEAAYHSIVSRWPYLADRVAIMSGDTVTEDSVAWIRAVGAPVLSKPFETKELVATITRLGRRDSRRTAIGE